MDLPGFVKFLNNIKDTTVRDLLKNTPDTLILNTVEELGEYAAARTIETGRKNKPLTESSKEEGVDLLICAFALFYMAGGTLEEFHEYGTTKLAKWQKRLGEEDVTVSRTQS